MTVARPKILVVDDHPLVCDGLCAAVGSTYPEYSVVGVNSAAGARKALEQRGNEWVLALCDLNLPDVDGIDLVREIRVQHRVPVVIMTGQADPITLRISKTSGASGFLEKSADIDQFRAALKSVLNGGQHFPESGTPLPATDPSQMSIRQKQVLDLLLDGRPNKVIADALGLGDGTVRNIVSSLFDLFSITTRSRSALISEATRLGFKASRKS